jgi:hypothetical protein
MKSKIGMAAFLILCCAIIAMSIRAGERHGACDKCTAGLKSAHTTQYAKK